MIKRLSGKRALIGLFAVTVSAALVTVGTATVLVDLDATTLPEGPLPTWQNNGDLGGEFVAEVDVPSVTTLDGVKGVTLDVTNDWYIGPPAYDVTYDMPRTIEAWIFNPTMDDEETVVAWGSRGGPDGSNMSFNHGVNGTFGAVGHWGAPDMGWNGNYAAGRWTYIAYTYDDWLLTSTVYFDGQVAYAEEVGILATWDTDQLGNDLPYVIGNQNEADGTRVDALSGSMTIARLRIHDVPLSDAEIAAAFGAEANDFGLGDPDADGLPSWYESMYPFLDPFNAADALLDQDGDGLNNLGEFNQDTDIEDPDTDGDGLNDGDEIAAGSNPLVPDTDGDGIVDGVEVTLGTDPTLRDSDGDQYSDKFELDWSSDPTDVNSVPQGLPASIGINFIGGYNATSPGVVTGFAGVQEQGNWNNYADVDNANGGPAALVDDSGANSGASVTWSGVPNTWAVNLDTPADGNAALMSGYLDTQDPGLSVSTVVVNNVSYPFYDVILYLGRDGAGSSGNYTANGKRKLALVHTTPWPIAAGNGVFIEAMDSGDSGNYTVFRNLKGSTLTVTAAASNFRGPLNGIQIVEVADSDADGLPDTYEEENGLDPNDPSDAGIDSDSDGLTNLQEFDLGTDPQNADTEGDLLNDGDEVAAGSDPFNPDTDQDGLRDGVETNSNPTLADTDGDTFPDGQEVFHGSDPSNAASTPVLDTPVALVDLDATNKPAGPLAVWPNDGVMGGNFFAETAVPEVVADGLNVKGVVFDGANNWYVGPASPIHVTGHNSRSIVAWVFNPEAAPEETVFAWGRRGGGDGTNLSFNHGTHDAWGAVGHWGNDGDVGWDPNLIDGDAGVDGQEKEGVWTFISYTYDAAANRTCVYTDGALTKCEDHAIDFVTWAQDTAGNALPFVLGNQNEAGGARVPDLSASMTISRVRVYDIPLQAGEIADQYAAELSYYEGGTGPVAPVISAITYASGTGVTLTWAPQDGVTYKVQVSSNLMDWTDLAMGISGGTYTDASGTQGVRFYRVVPE